mgnify:CR=1 FL=1
MVYVISNFEASKRLKFKSRNPDDASKIQANYLNSLERNSRHITDKEVKMLSHTVTPEIDTVAQLKRYAQEKGVNASKWNLVTGDKKQIYELARKSYLAVKTGKPDELYDMVHTENFILIDKNKRIRGFYDGTNLDQPTNDPKTKNMKQLLEDIIWLNENQK